MGQAKNRGSREERVAIAIEREFHALAQAEIQAQERAKALREYRGTASLVNGRLVTRGVSGMLALALGAAIGVEPGLIEIGSLHAPGSES